MNSEKETQLLELKPGGQMEVMKSGVCLDVDAKDKLQLVNGKVGERCVEVLRDTGCTGVLIKRDVVNQGELTGEKGFVTTFDKTLLIRAPIAKIEVDTPYYVGEVEALCVQEPVADLIIGNITGAREADNPDPERKLAAAAITRARARQGDNVKALNVKEVSSRFSVSREELCKLQSEDDELKAFSKKKDFTKRGEFEVKFEKRRGILYRIRRRIDELGETWKQIMIPKSLRIRVMEVAHDSIFGGHLAVKKTKDRIQTNFYWPRMHNDVSGFCRSCDICQKTVDKGTVARAPVGEMPLIDTPFKRVAVDLVGPITPASERGHRYILTLVDYATWYPEAVPLKNIDTETVAEALLVMYSRLGIPEEVLSDQGTQFVSSCMQEMSRLLFINRLTATPYHPIRNGLVERFNGTLKKMLRRLCSEQPRQWHRFINPLLFAHREVPQEATGFSPFELLYGRTVRGPVQILKELWTKETDVPEVKTSYQCVLELRERLDDTMKISLEELKRSQSKNKRLYDRGAKRRAFQVGDKVLILLPTDNNKLLLQWRGPFVVGRCGNGNNYGVEVNKRINTYHVNMLKLYFERKSDVESFGDTTTEPEESILADHSPFTWQKIEYHVLHQGF